MDRRACTVNPRLTWFSRRPGIGNVTRSIDVDICICIYAAAAGGVMMTYRRRGRHKSCVSTPGDGGGCD